MEKETLKVKAQVNENITFRMKGGRVVALTNSIQMKRMEKGVSGPSTQESLS